MKTIKIFLKYLLVQFVKFCFFIGRGLKKAYCFVSARVKRYFKRIQGV